MSVINTNIMSLNAQRHLSNSQSAMQTSMERLSSGLRINSAKDDAAGLAVGKLMGAQVASLNQGVRNANDGISMIQAAEGGLEEVHVMLERMKELATQAANGTYSDDQRAQINKEFGALKNEIDSVATRTKFNDNAVLADTAAGDPAAHSTVTIELGDGSDGLEISLVDAQVAALGTEDSKLTDAQIDTADNAKDALGVIDAAIENVSGFRADFGAAQNRLEHTVSNLQVMSENLTAAKSQIMDADFAAETASLTRAQVLQQAGTAMLAQANQAPQNVLSLLR